MLNKAYNMSLSLKLTRTANAGVLMEIDGVSILLDGVCEQLPPYLGTPASIREKLLENMPNVVAFTHKHPDHYDEDYAKSYEDKTLRSVYGPESLPFLEVGGVEISAHKTRHIGKTDIPHVSFVIKGSATVWFVGDVIYFFKEGKNRFYINSCRSQQCFTQSSTKAFYIFTEV